MSSILASASAAGPSSVWISSSGTGIYRATFDRETGRLGQPERIEAFKAGSWIASHPSKPILYSSYQDGERAGVASFKITDDNKLVRQSVVFLPPGGAAHIAVNPQATLLATSHWGGESSTLIALNPDGSLRDPALVYKHVQSKPGTHPTQTQARPHFAVFTADGKKVHQIDLGTDEIWTFDVAADPLTQTLAHKAGVPPGYGPRHLSFHPSLKFAYVSDELGSRISAFEYDTQTATFKPIQHLDSKGPADIEPDNNTSHILVHPSGRYVYIGNRGHDSIAAFAIDQAIGKLTFIETEATRGHWPRNFAIFPDGRWLVVAGQNSGTVGTMEIDPETGKLTFVRNSVINVPNPVCVLFR